MASARGDWDAAGEVLRALVERDDVNDAVRFHNSFMLGWTHVADEGVSFVC